MLSKKLSNITLEDFHDFIKNEVGESNTHEYKSELNITSESDRKEFLADITSFANADGGDIIFGIKEDSKTNLPMELIGIDIDNEDVFIRRIESILRDSISPRLPQIDYLPINIRDNKYIFLVRVGHSYLSPHRIDYKGWEKFYSRSSKGKYRMEIEELRLAFTMQQTLEKNIYN